MLDWLAVWGVTSAVGFAFKPILEDLAKDATKDWVKDIFKNSLSRVVRLPSKEPLDIAAGKALKEFLQLVQQELEDADLEDQTLRQYIQPLKQFIKDKSVKETFGDAFQESCQRLDTSILVTAWSKLKLRPLPDDFNWEKVGKRYLKKVQAIIRESGELSQILNSQTLGNIDKGVKEINY